MPLPRIMIFALSAMMESDDGGRNARVALRDWLIGKVAISKAGYDGLYSRGFHVM